MPKRFVSIWFRYLLTDREAIRLKSLRQMPVAFTEPDHGRMLVIAMNVNAEHCGVKPGMAAADARVIAPGIQLFESKPGRNIKLLKGLAEWCLRYTPLIACDAFFPSEVASTACCISIIANFCACAMPLPRPRATVDTASNLFLKLVILNLKRYSFL